MKAYKIDLSGYTGKVREVVSEAVQKKSALLEYDKTGTFCDFDKPYLFVAEEVGCYWADSTGYYSTNEYTAITAAAFLELTADKVNEPTFKPFDRVLVRDEDDECWRTSLFSHKDETTMPFVCAVGDWAQCIPYEGNEHLVGTTDSAK